MNERLQQRKRTSREVSAGGIVYKKQDGRVFVLLIMPMKRKEFKDSSFVPAWTFPKGLVGDHGTESYEQAALREVREETGVSASVIGKLGESNYFFAWQGQRIAKTVHFYLMEYVSGDTANHDNEVAEAVWFELDEAAQKLKYNGDKEMLKKAKQALI